MKTEELIAALAADRDRALAMPVRFAAAATGGMAISVLIFLMALGVRDDIAAAAATWQFDAKMAILVLSIAVGVVLGAGALRPEGFAPWRWLALVGLALGSAVALELATLPAGEWTTELVGSNSSVCLVAIPTLALAPLVLMLVAMRQDAPRSPAVAGASLGFAAWALGATLYGLHCFDDSPLFVAVWYGLAGVAVVATGALAGSRLLRW